RRRTLTEEATTKVLDTIRKLGDDEFTNRAKATEELTKMGSTVLPLLREAMKDRDAEVRRRATQIVESVEQNPTGRASCAAARLLVRSKPDGAAGVLLNYLPHAEDESVVDELRVALAALAVRDGKPEKALADALADKVTVRRGAAAEALI